MSTRRGAPKAVYGESMYPSPDGREKQYTSEAAMGGTGGGGPGGPGGGAPDKERTGHNRGSRAPAARAPGANVALAGANISPSSVGELSSSAKQDPEPSAMAAACCGVEVGPRQSNRTSAGSTA